MVFRDAVIRWEYLDMCCFRISFHEEVPAHRHPLQRLTWRRTSKRSLEVGPDSVPCLAGLGPRGFHRFHCFDVAFLSKRFFHEVQPCTVVRYYERYELKGSPMLKEIEHACKLLTAEEVWQLFRACGSWAGWHCRYVGSSLCYLPGSKKKHSCRDQNPCCAPGGEPGEHMRVAMVGGPLFSGCALLSVHYGNCQWEDESSHRFSRTLLDSFGLFYFTFYFLILLFSLHFLLVCFAGPCSVVKIHDEQPLVWHSAVPFSSWALNITTCFLC